MNRIKSVDPESMGPAERGQGMDDDAGRRSSQRLALVIPDVALNMFHGPNTQLFC